MWNPADRFLWTGTLGGIAGRGPEPDQHRQHPGGRADLGGARRWATSGTTRRSTGSPRSLWNTDAGAGSQLPAGVQISGVAYSSQAKAITGTISGSDLPNHRNAVWLEGNGHTALALLRAQGHRRPGDGQAAAGRDRGGADARSAPGRPWA